MSHPTPRYIYKDEPLTRRAARAMRWQSIEGILYEKRELLQRIQELDNALAELRAAPLLTHIKVEHTLYPGDPGYDEAPAQFDPAAFQGRIK